MSLKDKACDHDRFRLFLSLLLMLSSFRLSERRFSEISCEYSRDPTVRGSQYSKSRVNLLVIFSMCSALAPRFRARDVSSDTTRCHAEVMAILALIFRSFSGGRVL